MVSSWSTTMMVVVRCRRQAGDVTHRLVSHNNHQFGRIRHTPAYDGAGGRADEGLVPSCHTVRPAFPSFRLGLAKYAMQRVAVKLLVLKIRGPSRSPGERQGTRIISPSERKRGEDRPSSSVGAQDTALWSF